MVGIFLRLNSLWFFEAPSEDAYKFLVSYSKLHNFRLVKNHGVYYTTFKLDQESQHWWRGYLDSRLAGSLPLT